MFKLVSTTLALCALSAGAALAQTQDAASPPQDRQTQGQAGRDRKQAERERKDKNKEAGREPGTRCARWKRGKV